MTGGEAYQQLVKEQLGVDLSKPVGPAPGAQPIPSLDPRESLGSQAFEPPSAPPANSAPGGGTCLSSLMDEDFRRPDRAPPEEEEPLGRPAYVEPAPRRAFYDDRAAPKRSAEEDANRKLGLTVAVIFALVFSPFLQAKLAEYLPSELVFRESWREVLARAAILGLAVYAFRRFFTVSPGLWRAPRPIVW